MINSVEYHVSDTILNIDGLTVMVTNQHQVHTRADNANVCRCVNLPRSFNTRDGFTFEGNTLVDSNGNRLRFSIRRANEHNRITSNIWRLWLNNKYIGSVLA